MNEEFNGTVRETLLKGSVTKEDMDEILKVALLGGGRVEAANSKRGSEDDSNEGEAKSRQLDQFEQQASGEFVAPTYNPSVWAQTPKINTRLARCIRSYARNTVGLGWNIEPVHPLTPETKDKEKKAIEEQTEIVRSLFSYPNEKMPFTELCYLMKTDEESTGNGFIEVVRNNAGKIIRLYHVPATTMRKRVMRDESGKQTVYGFVQIRGNQKRYFKEFGDKRGMDSVKGEFSEGKDSLSAETRATEILHFMIYDPTNSYYGAPRYVPASTAIAGNRQSAIRNVNFFENDAVPRMALLVSGGRLTQDSMQQVEDFVRGKARGVDQAHRVMVIQVEPTKVGFQQQNKTAIELKPLTVGVTEDASFQTYRTANDEEVREIFGMAPVFFSTENVNKASSQVSREITNEQEFEPDRLAKEYIINQTIVFDLLSALLGNDPKTPDDREEMEEYRKQVRVQFRFARLTLTDPLDMARMDQIYASLGAMTPNEMREKIGKPPYPKDFYFADKPLSVAMAELTAGLALAIALDEKQAMPKPEMPSGAPGEEGAPSEPGMEPSAGGEPSAPEDAFMPEEPPTAFTNEPRGKQENPRLKLSSKSRSRGMSEGAFRIATELMADARRLVMMGASVGRGGSDER